MYICIYPLRTSGLHHKTCAAAGPTLGKSSHGITYSTKKAPGPPNPRNKHSAGNYCDPNRACGLQKGPAYPICQTIFFFV